MPPDVFNQMMTMHGTTMIFFAAMPILAGVANYIVPLQIGARDMAFPRLNALGLWVTLFGGILAYFSFATGGAPAIGWFAYAPLTEHTFARGAATDFWILGLLVSGVGSVSGAINLVTTVLSLRCPGMTLRKIPLYTWMAFWANVQILFAMPPLDRRARHAPVRPQPRRPLLRRPGGRLALLVAAPVLVLRPSRGLHPGAAGLRHDLRRDPGLLAQGHLRLRVRGRLDRGHRLHQLRRLGPPHVRRGDEPDRRRLLRRGEPGGRHPDRGQDVQLAGHGLRRPHGGWPRRCCSRSASCRCS